MSPPMEEEFLQIRIRKDLKDKAKAYAQSKDMTVTDLIVQYFRRLPDVRGGEK